MRISDWSSDVCSSDLEIGFQREFRAGIGLWRAAAAGVGCAQAHPGGLDAGDMLRTLKSERGGEPDEFHAFLRSEEHTSELQSLMRISYAVFCLKKKNIKKQ